MAKAILYIITTLLTQTAVSSSSFTIIDVQSIGKPAKSSTAHSVQRLPLLDQSIDSKPKPTVVTTTPEPVTDKAKITINPESLQNKSSTPDPVKVIHAIQDFQPETAIPPTIKKPSIQKPTVTPINKPISTVPPSIALPTSWQPKKRQSINAVIRKYMGKDSNEVPK